MKPPNISARLPPFTNASTNYQRLYQRIKQKKGHNVAIVAVARRLAELIWVLLTRNEEFIYAKPRLTEEKRARVKQLARQKAGLKLPRQPSNAIIKGTNLRGRDIKQEIYQRACNETLRIADLLELGHKLSAVSATGFNPHKPNHTQWQEVLKVVAAAYVREVAHPLAASAG